MRRLDRRLAKNKVHAVYHFRRACNKVARIGAKGKRRCTDCFKHILRCKHCEVSEGRELVR